MIRNRMNAALTMETAAAEREARCVEGLGYSWRLHRSSFETQKQFWETNRNGGSLAWFADNEINNTSLPAGIGRLRVP